MSDVDQPDPWGPSDEPPFLAGRRRLGELASGRGDDRSNEAGDPSVDRESYVTDPSGGENHPPQPGVVDAPGWAMPDHEPYPAPAHGLPPQHSNPYGPSPQYPQPPNQPLQYPPNQYQPSPYGTPSYQQPQAVPQWPQTPPGHTPYWQPGLGYYGTWPESSQAGLAVALSGIGLASILFCAVLVLLCPFGWWIAQSELKGITEGRRDPRNQGTARTAQVLGIIGTVLILVGVLGILALVVLA